MHFGIAWSTKELVTYIFLLEGPQQIPRFIFHTILIHFPRLLLTRFFSKAPKLYFAYIYIYIYIWSWYMTYSAPPQRCQYRLTSPLFPSSFDKISSVPGAIVGPAWYIFFYIFTRTNVGKREGEVQRRRRMSETHQTSWDAPIKQTKTQHIQTQEATANQDENEHEENVSDRLFLIIGHVSC